jgi:Ca-activated chloride channel family protein
VQAPTKEREEVLAAINRLTPQRRTAIGSGILTSLDAIFEGTSPNPTPPPDDFLRPNQPASTPAPVPPGTFTSAVIVLLSDGQSNTGPRPIEAAAKAAERGVKVYTVGVGSVAGAVLRMEGFAMRVRLDEVTLKNVAEATDGVYYNASTEKDLHAIYENLSSHLVFRKQQTEITAMFTGLALCFSLIAGSLSLLWFNRLP